MESYGAARVLEVHSLPFSDLELTATLAPFPEKTEGFALPEQRGSK